MKYTIRIARAGDATAIAGFTKDTFVWGDYVADAFPQWVEDPDGRAMVAVDGEDRAVAVAYGVMLSNTELWLQGARVSEPWRRHGIATTLSESLIEWGADRGARIARLLTEAWNEPAIRQVEQIGFRHSGDWVMSRRRVSDQEPYASGNGGQRARARRKLEITHSSESVPAWVSWLSGPLVRAARGMGAANWRWSRLTAETLERAGREGRLWVSQAGWVTTRHERNRLSVEWLECGPDDIDDMTRSIVDLAVEAGVEELEVIVPAVDWLTDTLARCGFEIGLLYLFERPL